MAKHTFKNISEGPRIVNGSEGPVTIAPGQSAEVDTSDAELKSAKATEWFDVGAKPNTKAAKEAADGE